MAAQSSSGDIDHQAAAAAAAAAASFSGIAGTDRSAAPRTIISADDHKAGGVDDEELKFFKGELARARAAKWAVELAMAAACIFWAAYWLVSPDPANSPKYIDKWVGSRTKNRFFNTDGRSGQTFIFQAIPFIVVTVLSFALVGLRAFIKKKEAEIYARSSAEHDQKSAASKITYLRKWQWSTHPLLVDRQVFGILTAAEVAGIAVIMFLIVYNFGRTVDLSFRSIDNGTAKYHNHSNGPIPSKSWRKVNSISFYFGTAAVIPFSLLWIPVSRGSVLLRVLGIPFEHAVRYHIWLANLMILLVNLHSIGYVVFYANTGQGHLTFEWVVTSEKCAVVAGLVAWILSVIIWITSLDYFRRRFYDLFFAIHHLYLLFSLFWIYHAIWNYHFFIIPMLLFFVDRFLRMVQSAKLVDVLSARVLESGAVELKFPLKSGNNPSRSGGLSYTALSTWCIQIAGVSKLQWHFFSGASSPLEDDSRTFSIIIKPIGNWTKALCDQLIASNNAKASTNEQKIQALTTAPSLSCPFSFKARVEGPYGDESDFYLRYKKLVLVSGGIGVTPILAMLRDILARYRNLQQIKGAASTSSLPSSITIYHCVRTPKELCVLNSVDPNQILPGYEAAGLSIKLHAYITSKNRGDLSPEQLQIIDSQGIREDAIIDISSFRSSSPSPLLLKLQPISIGHGAADPAPGAVSSIGPTGDNTWVARTTIASIFGYLLLTGFANQVIVKVYNGLAVPNYNRAHLVVASMLLGVGLFGGFVVLLWARSLHSKHRRLQQQQQKIINGNVKLSAVQPRNHASASSSPANPADDAGGALIVADDDHDDDEARVGLTKTRSSSPWTGDLQLFRRPNWTAVFDDLAAQNHGECVGVLVSGSKSMQEDIAIECRRRSAFSLDASEANVMFHYHSVSFNL